MSLVRDRSLDWPRLSDGFHGRVIMYTSFFVHEEISNYVSKCGLCTCFSSGRWLPLCAARLYEWCSKVGPCFADYLKWFLQLRLGMRMWTYVQSERSKGRVSLKIMNNKPEYVTCFFLLLRLCLSAWSVRILGVQCGTHLTPEYFLMQMCVQSIGPRSL